MTLSDASIKNPVFAWMLMIGLIAFGWIGFHLDAIVGISGNNASLRGYFTEYIAQGILPNSGGSGSCGPAPSSSWTPTPRPAT